MNLGGTSGSRLVTDWSDALWHSWGGWDCDVLGTGTARWKLGVYMSQITAVVIDYLTKSRLFNKIKCIQNGNNTANHKREITAAGALGAARPPTPGVGRPRIAPCCGFDAMTQGIDRQPLS